MTAYAFPELFVIIGKVVSIEVAPPHEIGASFPKNLTITGVNIKVIISLEILESSAITPSVLPEI